MRSRRRRGPAGLLRLARAAALVLAGVIFWRHAPRAPPPAAWDRLAQELIADAFDGEIRWNPVPTGLKDYIMKTVYCNLYL